MQVDAARAACDSQCCCGVRQEMAGLCAADDVGKMGHHNSTQGGLFC